MKTFLWLLVILGVLVLAIVMGRLAPADTARMGALATIDRGADIVYPTIIYPTNTPWPTATATATPNYQATEAIQQLAILAAQQTIDLATRQAGELTQSAQAVIDRATEQAAAATATRAEYLDRVAGTATREAALYTLEADRQAAGLVIAQKTAAAQATGTIVSATLEAARTQDALSLASQQRQAAVDATLEAAQVASVELSLERSRLINRTYAGLQVAALPALGAVLIMLLILIVVRLTEYKILRPDERGKMPVAIKGSRIVNPNIMVAGIDNLAKPRAISESSQVRVTMGSLAVDAARAIPGKAGDLAGRLASRADSVKISPVQPPPAEPNLPATAPWAALADHRRPSLLLGAGQAGLIELNPEKAAPSLVFAGTTGAGKTRYGIIPAAVCALKAGDRVIVGDKAGVDFAPILEHSNASLVSLQDPEDAIRLLETGAGEISRRENVLATNKAWLWSQLDPILYGPRTWIILDEFGTLGDELGSGPRAELWRWARFIAARGRKTGIHLILAVQNPTRSNVDPTIIRNCTKISFRVQDIAASLAILSAPGAERLGDYRFLANMAGALLPGVAFAPSNDDVRETLSRVRAPVLPPSRIVIDAAASAPADEKGIAENSVISLDRQGLGVTEIATKVFGYANGRTCAKVSDILRRQHDDTNDAPGAGI